MAPRAPSAHAPLPTLSGGCVAADGAGLPPLLPLPSLTRGAGDGRRHFGGGPNRRSRGGGQAGPSGEDTSSTGGGGAQRLAGGRQWPCNWGLRQRPQPDGWARRSVGRRWRGASISPCAAPAQGTGGDPPTALPGWTHWECRLNLQHLPRGRLAPAPPEASPQEALGALSLGLRLALAADQVYEALAHALQALLPTFTQWHPNTFHDTYPRLCQIHNNTRLVNDTGFCPT